MKRVAPAAERNREPILEVLRPRLPSAGLVLEIASGSGTHAVHFARALPHLEFQPTDREADALASIEGWRSELRMDNLRPALALDVTESAWPVDSAQAVFCANMVHIAPFAAAEGLFAGAGRVLDAGGRLFTYGPYLVNGRATTASNARFDASLRSRDPRWGLRDLADLDVLAQRAGLARVETIEMPAYNFLIVFERGDVEPLGAQAENR